MDRILLERWALGDLDAEARDAVERAFDADPALRARAEAVRSEIEAAAVELPALELPAEPARTGFPRWASLGGAVALAAAASAVLVVALWPAEQGVRYRGGAFDLTVRTVRLGRITEHGGVVPARAGDRLVLEVSLPEPGFVHVFDVQDDLALATWLPATEAGPGAPVRADVLLDDYPGAERVYVVVGDAPIEERAVRRALEWVHAPIVDVDALPLRGDPAQRSVLVVKEPR